MKVGLRLDKAAMQRFLLEHVEKIGMVVVAALAALVLYVTFAYRDLSYAKQPEMLVAQAEQAQQHWVATKPDDVTLPQLPNYGSIAGRSGQRTNPVLYSLPNKWEQQPFELLHPRGTPELFAAEDMRARAFRTVDRTIGSDTEKAGKHFVVVTGAIPMGEQVEAFHRAYDRANKKSPTGDEPNWSAVFVQRAEVLPNQPASEYNWSPPVNLREFAAKSGGPGGGSGEMLDVRFIKPNLTSALPSLDKDSYPPEIYSEKIAGPLYGTVVKNPEAFTGRKVTWPATSGQRESTTLTTRQRLYCIPSSAASRGEAEAQYYVVEFPTERAANAFSRLTAVTGTIVGGTRQQVVEPLAGGKTESREVEAPLLKFWMPADMEAQFLKLAEEQPRHSVTDLVERGNSGNTIDQVLQAEFERYLKPEYLLLRFVDFDVQLGKEYVYRVQLVLDNPNYKMEPAFLEDARTAAPQYVATDWSKPTEPVLVPRNTQIVLGSVVPPPQPTSDLRAKAALVRWLGDSGDTVSKDFTVARGAVLDFEKTAIPEAEKKITTPSNPVAAYDPYAQFQDDPSLVAQDDTAVVAEKPKGPNPDEFDFFTGAMVVDLAGGDSLMIGNRRTSAPGEMLLMMPSGNFVVHDQLSDEPKWQEHFVRNSHK